ncbi:MAG: hypothetical protein HND42_02640 [Armatimonadetes bacterium]|nr:MAG: hypothetical protein EDM73_00590 [Armatimonadota bacterium]MCE7898923.1 hypothetical protein [Armatimonadetes bacterium ATM1]MDL1927378.1 hypothetical protein [Fimbriimonadia bacterium ATM]MBC6969654.1 hypothetical protein [Armatimonadota bacterium]MBL1149092.1 hypothetical protein [Armatimonadota bacterium]
MKKPKLIDLNEAVQHPGRTLTFDLTIQLEEEEDLDLVQPLVGTLSAESTGNRLFVKGDFAGVVVMECGRCLAPVELPVSVMVDEEFAVEGTPAGFGTQGYAEVVEDEPSPLFTNNQLNYEELLRQDLWVSLPATVLCKSDCAGIVTEHETEPQGRPEFSVLSEMLPKETSEA